MNNAGPSDSLSPEAASRNIPRVLCVWLVAQLVLLAMGSGGVPLSARWPEPASSMALHVMLAGQIGVAGLIFPWLLGERYAAALVLAPAWPMLILSAIVSERPAGSLLAAGMMATLWLSAMAAWSSLLRSHHSQLIGVAIAALIFLGSAVAGYLGGEFAGPSRGCAPLADLFQEIDQPWGRGRAWLTPAAVLATAIIIRVMRSRSERIVHH